MTRISIRFPEDVIEDLKRVAPLRGFSGYQPLVRAYVGQGLRFDLERFETDPMEASAVRVLLIVSSLAPWRFRLSMNV